jgi:hypothetical protein
MEKLDRIKIPIAVLLAVTFVISVTIAIVGAADNTVGTGTGGTANNTSGNGTSGQVTVAKGTGGTETGTEGQVTIVKVCKEPKPTCDGGPSKVVCDKGQWKCA